MLKAIKEKFSESKINGCYFHFIKALWKKIRSFGLTKKHLLKYTKIIIFACKLYPFVLKENKKNYISGLYEYASNIDNKYNKFIEYFKNNWQSSEFLDFDQISNGEIINRTNNIVESFNHKLNSIVEYPHPRISVLVEKLKLISQDYYKCYIKKLFSNKINRTFTQNIYQDIYNFLEKFLKKYEKNISIKLLNQDDGDTKNIFENISNNILSELYNIDFNDKGNESKDEDNIEVKNYDLEQNCNDLEENWWANVLMDHINDNTKNINENKIKNNKPFEIDTYINVRKRTHWDIENDILKSLYGKVNNPKIKNRKLKIK